MRLFFAIDLPDDLTEAFATLQAEFEAAEGLSFTDPEQAHVTMKFLGEVDADAEGEYGDTRLADVKLAGAAAVDAYKGGQQPEPAEETGESVASGPFETEVGGIGVFPSPEYISVLWTGVRDGADELVRLHDALEAETTELGFDAEDHAFTPHFTLARMNDPRGKELIQDRLRDLGPTVGRFAVSELKLKRSELSAAGSEYETIARFPL
ncbi:MAG: RNA 2',3'-cyclic phosphodiesterase [Halolamina sp.]|uniref:RNA 2',3'-cyclic phosphodiesterase n=1 Tax=Halolamina sp. TaxID=1940283 RepID=UPI002FC32336